MSKAILRRTHGFVLLAADMEEGGGVSVTVPDEAYTVRELMERFVSGQRIPDALFRDGVFDSGCGFDSDDLEKTRDMDFADRDAVIERLKFDSAKRERKFKADQKRLLDSSKDVIDKDLSVVSRKSSKKVKRKGAAGPPRSEDAKRPSKGADEGSE